MAYGTLVTLDALDSNQQTIAQLGEDNVWAGVNAFLAAHNRIMAEMSSGLVERTTDRLRRFGGTASMTMDEVDELGTADAEKITAGANVGFPLRKYARSLQWTRNYLMVTSGEELAAQVRGLTTGDRINVERQIKRAMFTPTNTTFTDRLVDYVDLPVKALANADGTPLPVGINGETFDGATHTHYLATATFTAANLTSLITTVIEHFGTGDIVVYANKAQEAAIRGFAGFTAYMPSFLVQGGGSTAITAPGRTLDMINTGNRSIGVFDAAEVWVKPWIPANYILCYNRTADKPLAMRTRPGMGDLQLVFDDESHPLRARGYEREFGIGVWNRVNGAILYTGGGTYVTPTL